MGSRKTHDPNEVRMPLGDHLDELRSCLIRALAGLLVAVIVCFAAAKPLFSFIMRPAYLVLNKYGQDPALQSLSPLDSLMLYVKLALLSGLIVASPWILWQLWRFVGAGLYAHEQRYVRLAILPSAVLFLLGVAFMFYMVLPLMLDFSVSFNLKFPVPDWEPSWRERHLLGLQSEPEKTTEVATSHLSVISGSPARPRSGDMWFDQTGGRLLVQADDGLHEINMRKVEHQTIITNQYSIDFYASFILQMSLAFGLAFQLPVVVVVLALTGLVPCEQMAAGRRYVILGITIAAAALTPSPDILSQLLLGIPMLLLFEMGLITARILQRKRPPSGAAVG
jgi:sec-independent protein translocase protein TatC